MSDFIGDKQCVTHHDACDCREAYFKQLEADNKKLKKRLMEHGEALDILARLRMLYYKSPNMEELNDTGEMVKTAAQQMMKTAEEGLRLAHVRRQEEYVRHLQAKNGKLRDAITALEKIRDELQAKNKELRTALEAVVEEWNNRGKTKYGGVGAPCSLFMAKQALRDGE